MYLPFAILAFFLNAIAVTVDKFLLTKVIADPLIYIFYFSLVSLLSLVALPFIHIPSPEVLTLGSVSTLTWTAGAYFMFWALKIGAVQRVIPVIGVLTPLILIIFAQAAEAISINESWAAGILLLGLIFLTLPDWRGRLIKREFTLEILASISFALSYFLIRQAFLLDDLPAGRQGFLTVFVWSKPILIPLGILIFAIPNLRKRILLIKKSNLNLKDKSLFLFLFGQASAGISEFLLIFSISLASPALVNSLGGIKYVFLIGLGLMLGRISPKFSEKLSKFGATGKVVGIILLTAGLYVLSFAQTQISQPKLGVTYSPRYAYSLGLDAKMTYTAMLDELKIERIRLPVYWDEVEQFPGMFKLNINDFYLNEALKRNVEIILVLGYKQPRWPECLPHLGLRK